MSSDAIDYRLDSGLWMVVHPGVYRLASAPVTWPQALVAATLASPGSVISHRAAAIAWGLDGLGGRIVERSVPYPRSPELEGVVTHRSTDLSDTWVTAWEGVRITTPLRTLLDLGAVVRPWVVERAFASALGKRLITIEGARRTVDELCRRGRRGAGTFRAIVEAHGDASPPGVMEAAIEALYRRYQLPPGVPEYEVWEAGEFVARVDVGHPELRLAIEVNGYETHGTPAGFQRDHSRRNRLILAGWLVLEFTWHDVMHRPDYVAATISRAIAARRLEL